MNTSANPGSSDKIQSIAQLAPYQNRWTIKVRVMNKSNISTGTNVRGPWKVFNVDLCDDSGEIRAKAFNTTCDTFYDRIQVNKVYYISNCYLKLADKKYNNLKNNYEMSFTDNTEIVECMEDTSSIPILKYDFTPIKDINSKETDTFLDVIGVCKSTVTRDLPSRSCSKIFKKTEVTLVEDSGRTVVLNLWDDDADTFDGSAHPIIAVKGARIIEYNGYKSLRYTKSSVLSVNPDLPEAANLRSWLDNGGADMLKASSNQADLAFKNDEWITFSEAEAQKLGSSDKDDYFQLLGVFTQPYCDNAVYKACPQEKCSKKLLEIGNGLFRCEKCNIDSSNYKYKIMLSNNIVSDSTGDWRVSAFNKHAETMLGKDIAEICYNYENDKVAYTQIFEDVQFKSFVFQFRTRGKTFNNEPRRDTTVINVQPIDYKDANTRFISRIKSITGLKI